MVRLGKKKNKGQGHAGTRGDSPREPPRRVAPGDGRAGGRGAGLDQRARARGRGDGAAQGRAVRPGGRDPVAHQQLPGCARGDGQARADGAPLRGRQAGRGPRVQDPRQRRGQAGLERQGHAPSFFHRH